MTDPFDFVPYQPRDDEPVRKIATRAYHKKSRAGCQQCKARRVKCNEDHPICANCEKHNTICIWSGSPIPPTPTSREYEARRDPDRGVQSGWRSSLPVGPEQAVSLESAERRIAELRLLHTFTTLTAPSLGGGSSIRTKDWIHSVPPVAFNHESLLYAIYTITALHQSYLHPKQPEHIQAHQHYLGLCLRTHHDAVQNLSAKNADSAMLTASILRMCSVTSLRSRNLHQNGNYIPPSEWLIMNLGTGHGLGVAAWKFLQHEENSLMRRWISDASPVLDPSKVDFRAPQAFDPSNITPALSQVLLRTTEDEAEEPWDHCVQEAYCSAAAYVGNCQKAIETGEAEHSIMRRLILFPAIIDREFVDLVREGRERALALLAHQFSLWRRCSDVWWFEGVGDRELEAIREAVSPRWKVLLP